jgi:hypothetical protein
VKGEVVVCLPTLKVAICSRKMNRLDMKNTNALMPAGPNGNHDQKRSVELSTGFLVLAILTYLSLSLAKMNCSKQVVERSVSHVRIWYATLRSRIVCMAAEQELLGQVMP